MIINNKKGDSTLLSIWWFAVLVVIAVGIVASVFIFYSNKVDVRVLEASILLDRLNDCIAQQGNINQEFLTSKFEYIYTNCGINDTLIKTSTLYFIKISIFDKEGKALAGFPVTAGNNAFDSDCAIGAAMKGAINYARCSEKEFFIKNNGDDIKLVIKVGSNNEYKPMEASK